MPKSNTDEWIVMLGLPTEEQLKRIEKVEDYDPRAKIFAAGMDYLFLLFVQPRNFNPSLS